MKKIIIALLFVASPLVASAQVVPATYADVASITQRIHDLTIQILTMQIAELQEQIRVMIAAQTTALSTKIDNISGAGVPVVETPAPAPVASLIIGPQRCNRQEPIVPINLTNVSYDSYILRTIGNNTDSKYTFQPGGYDIDWLSAGTYEYELAAKSGNKVVFAQNGTVVVQSCN